MTSSVVRPAAIVVSAAAPIMSIVGTLDPAALAASTPCAEFDVRALLHHLLQWGPVLESCARKESAVPLADPDLVVGDWRGKLEAQLGRTANAWADPAAWEGTTSMGGPVALPATVVGGMVVGEFVVHGWDLGSALGLTPEWDDDVLEFLHREIAATAEMGRQMEVYGPEVLVPPTAATLDRLLGLTGRARQWTPRADRSAAGSAGTSRTAG